MKLTANKIFNMYDALMKLSKLDLSLVTAITIADNIDTISTPYKVISDKRDACIQKYAKKDADGNYEVPEDNPGAIIIENVKEYMEEMNKIFEVDIDIDLKEFSLEGEKITITPADILALRPLIKISDKTDKDEKN